MSIVRWVTRGHEVSSIATERYTVNNPDMIADACRLRLSATQARNPESYRRLYYPRWREKGGSARAFPSNCDRCGLFDTPGSEVI
jgi:hypothetical protein